MKQKLLAAALVLACALASTTTHAQNSSTFDNSFTLAANDAVAPAGGAGADAATPADDKANQEAELAKKLQNPVAALISVPIQNNWDFGIGPAHAMKYTANIQPVVPISISEDWNLIIRTIVPVIYAEATVNNPPAHRPVSDKVTPVWATPRRAFSSRRKIPWAAGFWAPARWVIIPRRPRIIWAAANGARVRPSWRCNRPTASPTAFWPTRSGRSPASRTVRTSTPSFIQPFVSFTTKTYTTFGVNTESTYNWQANQATVPLNFTVQQLIKIGKQPIALQAGYRYYVNKPDGGPDWGLRFTITFLFPK